jgi:hypothetical protein
MTDEKRGGPPSRGGPGGGNREGRPGGGRRDDKRGGPRKGGFGKGGPAKPGPGGRDDRGGGRGGGSRDGGGRGGPRKGGGFGKGPVKQARAETYESLKELTRGEGFRIDKFMVAEKGTHKLVKTEYRLTREGLKDTQTYQRLVDAQAAAIAPLPEPEPEPVEETLEAATESAQDEGGAPEESGESDSVEAITPVEGGDSVEHVAAEKAAD